MHMVKRLDNENYIQTKDFIKSSMVIIAANLTQPLLGAVDTAVMGRIGTATQLSAVSLGATMFNTIFWLVAFLRVNTTALSAQNYLLKEKNSFTSLGIPLLSALGIGLTIVLARAPIKAVFLFWYRPTIEMRSFLIDYYDILILGAPFVLVSYVVTGWLMGQMNIKTTLSIQLVGNLINIALDLFLGAHMGFGVAGIAYATLVAQVISCCLGLIILKAELYQIKKDYSLQGLSNHFMKQLANNRDLFLRTLCIVGQNNIFSKLSLNYGLTVMASNSILLQVISVMTYLMEGLGNNASIYSGRAKGLKSDKMFRRLIQLTLHYTVILAMIEAVIFLLFSEQIIRLFVSDHEVVMQAMSNRYFVVAYPLIAGISLSFYGIFTGSSSTRTIRNSTIIGFILYLLALWLLVPIFGVPGLWSSYLIFYMSRTSIMFLESRKTKFTEDYR